MKPREKATTEIPEAWKYFYHEYTLTSRVCRRRKHGTNKNAKLLYIIRRPASILYTVGWME